ncbi:MAG: hypothetical protein WBO09_01845 [Methylocystis silviterrae]|uniref:hypothetical protein n=1 Tax=Methylocystis silviterrae TaxID=2743612 RepID=UPI003C76E9C6
MGSGSGPSLIMISGRLALVWRRGWRVELFDELVEDGFELGVVLVSVRADDVDDLPVAVCRLPMIASGLMDHAQAIIAVMHVRKALEELPGGAGRIVKSTDGYHLATG